jgi:SAM-dependent methyltransferase
LRHADGVHRKIKRRFHAILRRSGRRFERALEVGGVTGPDSLLDAPQLEGAERYCLNLLEQPGRNGVITVAGDANDMHMFEDRSFDLVLCNATLEHDKRFWLSVAEMRRVLRPGGLLVIGVPGYVRDPETDHGYSTHTYRVHYSFDYYRFSEQAVREVLLEGMRRVRVARVLTPPRLIGHGYKPAEAPRPRRQRRAPRLRAAARRVVPLRIAVAGARGARRWAGSRRGLTRRA